MARNRRKFSPEFKEEAAKMVVETSQPIAHVARELDVNETTLGNWVKDYREKHADDEPALPVSERARLRELERENRELKMRVEFLSKAAAYFAAEHQVTEKYEFIDAEYAARAGDSACAPTVVQMCKWLEVSRSGFYDWKSRPESETAKRRELLKIKVKALFEANNGEYGYRRLHRALLRGGERCSPELVRRLMRELGLVPCQPRPWRHSLTEQDGQAAGIPNLVRRDFTAERPGQKMVGDITYIPTWQGWLFLATVIDCATRKIVGWAMDDNYKTPLIISAVEMAARNLDLPGDAVFHSDRGSNYTSGTFAAALERLGIRQSVGRTGICYDNALSESVNASLKVELVHRTVYPTLRHARKDIARWIELRYNRTRLHSGIGYRTPQEVMDELLNKQVAA